MRDSAAFMVYGFSNCSKSGLFLPPVLKNSCSEGYDSGCMSSSLYCYILLLDCSLVEEVGC